MSRGLQQHMVGPRLAMSNIGWPPDVTAQAYELLQEFGFSGVEIAPGLLFRSEDVPRRPSASAIQQARAEVERYDLNFMAMQSLHFGMRHAQLFGDRAAIAAFADAIEACSELARRLGVSVLTLGSAANRSYPDGLSVADASNRAREVLLSLADNLDKTDVKLAIEPISRIHGTNFLNTLEEALAFVRFCDHPAIVLNFDTGAMAASGEIGMLAEHYQASSPWIGHIHVSTRDLRPVTCDDRWINTLCELRAQGRAPAPWMSAEMHPDPGDGLLAARTAAAALATHAGRG